MFLFNKRAIFAFASCVIICICVGYTSAFLSDELRTTKKMPVHLTGFVLALPMLTYTFSTITISYVIGRYPRRIYIFVSFLIMSIAMLLQGPSEIFFEDSNYLLLLGFSLSGLA